MLLVFGLLTYLCILADASSSIIAPSTTKPPSFQNVTSTSMVGGVTAPSNQCGQCIASVYANTLRFDGVIKCTVATVFETIINLNGKNSTSTSEALGDTSSCNPFGGHNGPVTYNSEGLMIDGFTLNYSRVYSDLAGYGVLFSSIVSQSCLGPSGEDIYHHFTPFPALGVTSSRYIISPNTVSGTDPEETFLSLIDATSCIFEGDGAPTEISSVFTLTVTSSFFTRPKVTSTIPQSTLSSSIFSTKITTPSASSKQASTTVESSSDVAEAMTAASESITTSDVSASNSAELNSASDSTLSSLSHLSTPSYTTNPSTSTQTTGSHATSSTSATSALISTLLGDSPLEATSATTQISNSPEASVNTGVSTLLSGDPSLTIESTQVLLTSLTAPQLTGPGANAPTTANSLILSSSITESSTIKSSTAESSTAESFTAGSSISVSSTSTAGSLTAESQTTGSFTSVDAFSVISQASQSKIIKVGVSTISPNAASQNMVGDQTLAPEAAAITVSDTLVSLASSGSALIVDGKTQTLVLTEHPVPLITIAGSVIALNTAGQYNLGSQTLTPGSAITVSGTTISLAPSASAIVINGITFTIQAAEISQEPVLTIAGQLLTSGAAITISGTTISLAPSTSAVVINGITSALASSETLMEPILMIAGQTLTPNTAGQYIIDSQTLAPGSVITVSGSTISLTPSINTVIINGITSAVKATAQHFTIAGLTLTPNTGSGYVVEDQTLTGGSAAITVSGSTISLVPSTTAIVINGITSPLPNTLPTLTLGATTLTPNTAGQYIASSQTLIFGSAITVDGMILSFIPTETAEAEAITTLPITSGLGALIMSELGVSSSTIETATMGNGTAFTGAAGRMGVESMRVLLVAAAVMVLGMGVH